MRDRRRQVLCRVFAEDSVDEFEMTPELVPLADAGEVLGRREEDLGVLRADGLSQTLEIRFRFDRISLSSVWKPAQEGAAGSLVLLEHLRYQAVPVWEARAVRGARAEEQDACVVPDRVADLCDRGELRRVDPVRPPAHSNLAPRMGEDAVVRGSVGHDRHIEVPFVVLRDGVANALELGLRELCIGPPGSLARPERRHGD